MKMNKVKGIYVEDNGRKVDIGDYLGVKLLDPIHYDPPKHEDKAKEKKWHQTEQEVGCKREWDTESSYANTVEKSRQRVKELLDEGWEPVNGFVADMIKNAWNVWAFRKKHEHNSKCEHKCEVHK